MAPLYSNFILASDRYATLLLPSCNLASWVAFYFCQCGRVGVEFPLEASLHRWHLDRFVHKMFTALAFRQNMSVQLETVNCKQSVYHIIPMWWNAFCVHFHFSSTRAEDACNVDVVKSYPAYFEFGAHFLTRLGSWRGKATRVKSRHVWTLQTLWSRQCYWTNERE